MRLQSRANLPTASDNLFHCPSSGCRPTEEGSDHSKICKRRLSDRHPLSRAFAWDGCRSQSENAANKQAVSLEFVAAELAALGRQYQQKEDRETGRLRFASLDFLCIGHNALPGLEIRVFCKAIVRLRGHRKRHPCHRFYVCEGRQSHFKSPGIHSRELQTQSPSTFGSSQLKNLSDDRLFVFSRRLQGRVSQTASPVDVCSVRYQNTNNPGVPTCYSPHQHRAAVTVRVCISALR